MLSISFDADREWWVSGAIFERLFDSALKAGELPQELAEWRHIADANGGLDLSLIEQPAAGALSGGLRRAAQHELARFGDADPATPDGGYASALRRLLDLLT
jgi:hypothetical protein